MCQKNHAIVKLCDGTVLLARNAVVLDDRLKLEEIKYSRPDEEYRSSCDEMVIHKDATEVFFILHIGEKS